MIKNLQMLIAGSLITISGTTLASETDKLALATTLSDLPPASNPVTITYKTDWQASALNTNSGQTHSFPFLLKTYDDIHFSLQKALFDMPTIPIAGPIGLGFGTAWDPTVDQDFDRLYGPAYLQYNNTFGAAISIHYKLKDNIRIALISSRYNSFDSEYFEISNTGLYIGTTF